MCCCYLDLVYFLTGNRPTLSKSQFHGKQSPEPLANSVVGVKFLSSSSLLYNRHCTGACYIHTYTARKYILLCVAEEKPTNEKHVSFTVCVCTRICGMSAAQKVAVLSNNMIRVTDLKERK